MTHQQLFSKIYAELDSLESELREKAANSKDAASQVKTLSKADGVSESKKRLLRLDIQILKSQK